MRPGWSTASKPVEKEAIDHGLSRPRARMCMNVRVRVCVRVRVRVRVRVCVRVGVHVCVYVHACVRSLSGWVGTFVERKGARNNEQRI